MKAHKKLTAQNIYNNFFCDKNGNTVLFQFPNAPLLLCLAASAYGILLYGKPQSIATYIFNASFLSWAIL